MLTNHQCSQGLIKLKCPLLKDVCCSHTSTCPSAWEIQAFHSNTTDKLTFLYQKQSKSDTEVYKQRIIIFFFRARTIFPLKKIVTCKDSSNSCLCLLHVYRYSPVLQSSSNTAQCRRSYALSLSSHYCQSHCLGQLWDFSNSLLRANAALEDKYVRHFSEGSKI